MPLEYLRELSGHQRQTRGNRHLGLSLAFIAGAVNAGGFLAVGHYTSHMTGLLSATADHLALGEVWLALTALVAMLAFVSGAASTALLINWAQRRGLRSHFALSLLLEAMLLSAVAGALATLVYCVHCPEMAAPFIAVWYVAGIALPTVLGEAV